jgi:hypothetical protein
MTEADARSSLVPAWFIAHRRPIVWLAVVVLTGLTFSAFALGYAARPGAQPFAPQDPIVFLGSAAVIAAYACVSVVLVLRVPDNVVGWIFGAFAVVVATSNIAWAYVTYATETVPPQLPGVEAALLLGATSVPWWTFCLVALITCFPDGRPISKAWGWLVIAAALLATVGSLALAFSSGPLPAWAAESPLALPGPSGIALAAAARVVVAMLVAMALAAVWSLTIRYRAADDIGRLQLKWLVYAGGVFIVCGMAFWLLAGSAYEQGSSGSTAIWVLFCAGAIVVPLAALVAILRYHLYEIETIIGRTLVYGSLTAILAGIYTAGIRLFNWLFVEMTGEDSDVALVVTTLVLATTFTPIKTWLEAKVKDRRGVIHDPALPAERPADLESERIAERAAAIVMERLAAGPRATAPPPPPERATVE